MMVVDGRQMKVTTTRNQHHGQISSTNAKDKMGLIVYMVSMSNVINVRIDKNCIRVGIKLLKSTKHHTVTCTTHQIVYARMKTDVDRVTK